MIALAYDAFGERAEAGWQGTLSGATLEQQLNASGITTRRGFTDHEHLDTTGLIHMNGRVYDPALGRFLSPDPFVQFPDHSQSWNRYSYLRNNPLASTDPSGYLEEIVVVADFVDTSFFDSLGSSIGFDHFGPTNLPNFNPGLLGQSGGGFDLFQVQQEVDEKARKANKEVAESAVVEEKSLINATQNFLQLDPKGEDAKLQGRLGLFGSAKGNFGGVVKFQINLDLFSLWTDGRMTQGISIDGGFLGSPDFGLGVSRVNWHGGAPGAWNNWQWGGGAFNVHASQDANFNFEFGLGLGVGVELSVPIIENAY